MRIYNKIGSKERIIEMFNNVNKIKLNENMREINPIILAFEKLKNNLLKIEKTQTRVDDVKTYIIINASDNENNKYMFVFEIDVNETAQDDVFDVNRTTLTDFSYNGNKYSDDEINDFNKTHNSKIFDVIDKYVDIDSDDSYSDDIMGDEMLEEFGKSIDSIDIDENDYPSKLGKEFKTSSNYPKQKKERPKKVKISEEDDMDDDTLLEPENTEIDTLAKDREERGDEIEGGLGDDKSPLEFDPEQIKLGMGVEMEHTNDPLIALEIALDHLTEDPEYYTVKDNPEASAQANASQEASEDIPHESGAYIEDGMAGEKDRNGHPIPAIDPNFSKINIKQNSDDELTDILLGYKPKNIGDDINENEYEEYDGNIGDKYVDNEGNKFTVTDKVNGGVTLRGRGGEKEISTNDLKQMKKNE